MLQLWQVVNWGNMNGMVLAIVTVAGHKQAPISLDSLLNGNNSSIGVMQQGSPTQPKGSSVSICQLDMCDFVIDKCPVTPQEQHVKKL